MKIFNRTFRNKIWKYFAWQGTIHYRNMLQTGDVLGEVNFPEVDFFDVSGLIKNNLSHHFIVNSIDVMSNSSKTK